MSSNNGSVLPAQPPTFESHGPASESTTCKPGLNGHESPESAEPAKVLDDSLDDPDVKLVISIDLHGRTTKFTTLRVERTVADGLDVTNHWMLLRGLREALDDVGRGVRHRIKGKLGAPPS